MAGLHDQAVQLVDPDSGTAPGLHPNYLSRGVSRHGYRHRAGRRHKRASIAPLATVRGGFLTCVSVLVDGGEHLA